MVIYKRLVVYQTEKESKYLLCKQNFQCEHHEGPPPSSQHSHYLGRLTVIQKIVIIWQLCLRLFVNENLFTLT